jgi:hypothetical protein
MKSILTVALALMLSICTFSLKAQYQPEFPELKVKDDYVKSAALFLEVTGWLNETDLGTQEDLRARSNKFIMDWLMGSPTVNVAIGESLLDLVDKNSQLLPIYMANNASYSIRNANNKETTEAIKAGLNAVAKIYKKGIGVNKTKALDKLATAADKNKLDNYIIKHLPNFMRGY